MKKDLIEFCMVLFALFAPIITTMLISSLLPLSMTAQIFILFGLSLTVSVPIFNKL